MLEILMTYNDNERVGRLPAGTISPLQLIESIMRGRYVCKVRLLI